jgi:3-hydroxyacyl-[acyl-carrier-protein] dehydratase
MGTLEDINLQTIFDALPHRYPFLLVDRVVEYKADDYICALKNVTNNEPFFTGHFPGHPVMPGVLIIEALAQASGVLTHLSTQQDPSTRPLYYLVKVDKARFSRTVLPGDQLMLHVNKQRELRGMGFYECRAEVDGKVVAKAEIVCAAQGG